MQDIPFTTSNKVNASSSDVYSSFIKKIYQVLPFTTKWLLVFLTLTMDVTHNFFIKKKHTHFDSFDKEM